MEYDWHDFIDQLEDDEGKLSKNKLKALIINAKDDPDKFIRQQGEKLENCINRLASGQLTPKDFEYNIIEIKNSTKTEALKLSLTGRFSAQGFITSINDLIIDGLLAMDLEHQIMFREKKKTTNDETDNR